MMTRGRITLLVALAAALAIVLSGCGDSNAGADNASSDSVAETTGPTSKSNPVTDGATAGTSKSSKAKAADDLSASKTQKAADEFADKSKAKQYGSPAAEQQIKRAVAAVAAATDKGDAETLCNDLYASSLVKQLDAQGGCVKITSKQIAPFSKYKIKPNYVQFFSNEDAMVLAKSTFKYNSVSKKAEPTLNYMLENGKWKYYIRSQ